MNIAKLGALALFLLTSGSAFAVITDPTIAGWSIDGQGPAAKYLPGSSITVSLQISGLRNNPTQNNSLDVNVYLSRVQNNFTSPAAYLGFITASLPANQFTGPNVAKTFTLPTTFASTPTSAGSYYIVFSAVGASSSDVKSSSFSIYTPNIQVQNLGSDLNDASSTVSFGETSASGFIPNNFTIYSTGGGDLQNVAVSISGTNASSFSLTTAPPLSSPPMAARISLSGLPPDLWAQKRRM